MAGVDKIRHAFVYFVKNYGPKVLLHDKNVKTPLFMQEMDLSEKMILLISCYKRNVYTAVHSNMHVETMS